MTGRERVFHMTENKKKKISIGEMGSIPSLKHIKIDKGQFKGIPKSIEFDATKVKTGVEYQNGAKVSDRVVKYSLQGYDDSILQGFKGMAGLDAELVENMMSNLVPLEMTIEDLELVDKFAKDLTAVNIANTPYIQLKDVEFEIYPRWVEKGGNGSYAGLRMVLSGYGTVEAKENSTQQEVLEALDE